MTYSKNKTTYSRPRNKDSKYYLKKHLAPETI